MQAENAQILSLSTAQESRKDSISPLEARLIGYRLFSSQGKHRIAAALGWPVKIPHAERYDKSLARTENVLPLKQTRLYFFPEKKK